MDETARRDREMGWNIFSIRLIGHISQRIAYYTRSEVSWRDGILTL
jgi:hypothetical protein